MSAIIITILASLVIGLAALTAFIWAVKNGQLEDQTTPAYRILMDESKVKTNKSKKGLSKSGEQDDS
ncbi:MAG: cbb3-type cytochrome oxidase assembly protein CcoS [Calditrichaeota bacterium]|jgi:cbb3-type cytochrome oxidase maturation protein|nr:cbb3-type cytochrome oxidase assembly protein CcoS [Calditrichota bacterium]